MDEEQESPRTSLYFFESVLRISIWFFLGIQVIVVLFFPTVKLQYYDFLGILSSVKSVPNPAVIWMAVFIGADFLSWLYIANKTDKMRFWWLGVIAITLSCGMVFLTKNQRSITTYHGKSEGYPAEQSPAWRELHTTPYRGY